MQYEKFHICLNCLAIPSHSASDAGALTNSGCSTSHIISHIFNTISLTVEPPIRKLKESDAYSSELVIQQV